MEVGSRRGRDMNSALSPSYSNVPQAALTARVVLTDRLQTGLQSNDDGQGKSVFVIDTVCACP